MDKKEILKQVQNDREKNMLNETNQIPTIPVSSTPHPEPIQNIPQPQPVLKKNNGLNILIIVVGVLFLMGITGFGVWTYMSKIEVEDKDEKKITETKPEATTLPENEESKVDETAEWKTYTARAYSIKYPSSWIVEDDGGVPAFQISGKVWKDISSTINIYNPSSMQDFCGNGGCNGTKIPSEKIVIGTLLSNKTAKEIVDSECSTAELKALSLCQTFLNERKTININGLTAEQYPDTGEGSTGNNIVVSSGNALGAIHVTNSSNVKTVDQILSTFKFTDTKQADDMAGWKTYENEEYGFEFKYPSDKKVLLDNQNDKYFGICNLNGIGAIAIYPNGSILPQDTPKLEIKISIDIKDNSQDLSVDNWVMNNCSGSWVKTANKENITVAGINATKYIGTGEMMGKPEDQPLIVISKDKKLFFIKIYSQGESFDQILSTFKFTN